jgi:hypothetical protein
MYWVESYHRVIGKANDSNGKVSKGTTRNYSGMQMENDSYFDDTLVDGYSQDILENSYSLLVIP